MHLFKTFLIAYLVSILLGCASLQPKEPEQVAPFSAQGWGGTTCEELIHDISPKKVGFEQAVKNVNLYQSWISGFISGVNYARNDVYDVSGATDPEDSFKWVKQHCDQHLDKPVPEALHELLDQWQQEEKVLTDPQ